MAGNPATDGNEWLRLAQQLADEIRKRRRAAGLSQPALAAQIGYTPQYVSLAERPKRGLASAALVQAIDAALGASGALVALRDQAEAARKACRPGASPTMEADDVTKTGRKPGQLSDSAAEVENSKRRELITSAAAIAFGASLDQPVDRILAAADEPQVPTRVGAGDVLHLRSSVEILEAEDSRAGGVAVRHRAVAALRWAPAMLESSCTPAVRRDLAATTAELADIAAWTTFDAGYHDPARQVFLLGLQAARESGDLGIRAHVASCLVRQEILVGNCAGGLELIQLAFTAGDSLTLNAIADLHTVKALAYARKRDTAECRRCIGAATDSFRPDSASNDPAWLSYFTHTKLEGDLASARYDLLLEGADVGDCTAYRRALIGYFSTAFRQYPAGRRKAITAVRLATLLCLEGEQRMAHQMAEDAIVLSGQIRSIQLADDLQVLIRTLPTGDGADEYARDLRQRLSAVLAEMT